MHDVYDVIVIGGGAVGSTIARELSRYRLKITVVEKNPDVVCETSGRNSGVIHAGFNNKSGSLMARYCVEGNAVFPAVCRELGVPYKITGKLVIGFTKSDIEKLEELKEQGDRNRCPDLRIVSADEIKRIEPHVEGNAALYSPHTGIFNPFQYTIAMAENALENGVSYYFGGKVVSIIKANGCYKITDDKGREFKARWIINSAGLSTDGIARLVGVDDYTVYPCRGEYYVLDKAASEFLKIPVYPVPNESEGGLGIHLTPTIEGNILIGPSSEYILQKEDYATTRNTLDMLIREGSKLMPSLKKEHFISAFAGIRPKLAGPDLGGYLDFEIFERDETPQVIHLIGIESPGLTSSVPIAKDIVRMIEKREHLVENDKYNPIRKYKVKFNELPEDEKAQHIHHNPEYGEIICRCQQITKQEVLDAIHNPLGAQTLAAVKARTSCMMGRCQGGFCQTRIVDLLMKETGKKAEDILYCRENEKMFFGRVR